MERFFASARKPSGRDYIGFDRMRFTGTLRWMAHVEGMGKFLNTQGVLLKNFGGYIEEVSEQLKAHAYRIAEAKRRPVQ